MAVSAESARRVVCGLLVSVVVRVVSALVSVEGMSDMVNVYGLVGGGGGRCKYPGWVTN